MQPGSRRPRQERPGGQQLWITPRPPEHQHRLPTAAVLFAVWDARSRGASSRDTRSRASETSLLLMQRSPTAALAEAAGPSEGPRDARQGGGGGLKGALLPLSRAFCGRGGLISSSQRGWSGSLSADGWGSLPRAGPQPEHRQSAGGRSGPACERGAFGRDSRAAGFRSQSALPPLQTGPGNREESEETALLDHQRSQQTKTMLMTYRPSLLGLGPGPVAPLW